MTQEDFLSLRQGDEVVITSVVQKSDHSPLDTTITEKKLKYYKIGQSLIFLEFHPIRQCYNFLNLSEGPPKISHFREDIYKYIERKIVLEREVLDNVIIDITSIHFFI